MSDAPIRGAGSQTFEQLLARSLNSEGAPPQAGGRSNAGGLRSSQGGGSAPGKRVAFKQMENDDGDEYTDAPEYGGEYASFSSQFEALDAQLDAAGGSLGEEFEDGAHEEQELNGDTEYNDDEVNAGGGFDDDDEQLGDQNLLKVQTSFPLPSLARTHPLSPLKESSQEIDTERLRRIHGAAAEEEEDDGTDEDRTQPHEYGADTDSHAGGEEEAPLFQTAIFLGGGQLPRPATSSASPKHAAKQQAKQQRHVLRRSQEDLEEFERIEAELLASEKAAAESAEDGRRHQNDGPQKKLRPSTAQLHHSLTRQQMQDLHQQEQAQLAREAQQRHHQQFGQRPNPAAQQQAQSRSTNIPIFDDDEEWIDPAAATPSSAASKQHGQVSQQQPQQPRRKAPQFAADDEPDAESEELLNASATGVDEDGLQYAASEEAGEDEDEYEARDPLSMAQVIPSSYTRAAAAAAAANSNKEHQQQQQQQQQRSSNATASVQAESGRSPPGYSRGAAAAAGTGVESRVDAVATSAATAHPPQSNVVKKYFASAAAQKQRPNTAPASAAPTATSGSNKKKSGPGSNKKSPGPTSPPSGSGGNLQVEIDRVHSEALRLRKLNREQELELSHLRTENAAARDRLAKEREEFERSKEEEVKKLKAARAAIEREKRALSGAPTRGDRETIETLQRQLSSVSAELSETRERSAAAIERARKERETLLTEIKEMKHEMKQMELRRIDEAEQREKEHARQLEAAKRSSGTAAAASRPLSTGGGSEKTYVAPREDSRALAASVPRTAQPGRPTAAPGYAAPNSGGGGHGGAAQARQMPRPPAPNRGLLDRGAPLHLLSVTRELSHAGGKTEKFLSDSSRLILFKNGTTKRIMSDGCTVVSFPNGDKKQTEPDGRVLYYYASADTTHTTYPDGIQVYEFANQQIERHFPDGRKQIFFADGIVKTIDANGTEEALFPDRGVQRMQH
jgi:hypothetical protein